MHNGGNDIGKVNTVNLIAEMKQTFSVLKGMWPSVILIFSEIIPRRIWGLPEWAFMHRIRRRINRCMMHFLPVIGGFAFRHIELEGFLPGLFREDWIHLSEIGLDIFNNNLQVMVERALLLIGGGDMS